MKVLVSLILLLLPQLSFAHVKWFSDYNFQTPPLQLSDLNTPIFWGLFILSVVSMPIMVWLDKVVEKSATYKLRTPTKTIFMTENQSKRKLN